MCCFRESHPPASDSHLMIYSPSFLIPNSVIYLEEIDTQGCGHLRPYVYNPCKKPSLDHLLGRGLCTLVGYLFLGRWALEEAHGDLNSRCGDMGAGNSGTLHTQNLEEVFRVQRAISAWCHGLFIRRRVEAAGGWSGWNLNMQNCYRNSDHSHGNREPLYLSPVLCQFLNTLKRRELGLSREN